MKAHVKSSNGRIVVEVEADNIKQLFAGMAAALEILDPDPACGACGSLYIRPRVRTVDKYTYFEYACDGCGAALAMGQRTDGENLYPRRKAEDGRALPDRGWVKYLGAGGGANA